MTNDYPPKTGGIQVYLHELWQRLEAGRRRRCSRRPRKKTREISTARAAWSSRRVADEDVSTHRHHVRSPPSSPRLNATSPNSSSRSRLAPRSARSTTVTSLRRGAARRGGSGTRSTSLRGVVASLRPAPRERRICEPVPTPRTKRGESRRSTWRRSFRCPRAWTPPSSFP